MGNQEKIMKKNIILALCLLVFLPAIASAEISTIVVVVPAPSPTSSRGDGSSGGGTGGAGIITDEPFSNILKYESKENTLISGKPVRYTFSRYPDIPVYEIDLTGKENENYITVKVELLKGLSPKVRDSPTGVVYRYFNAYAGTKRIQEAKIRFRVSNEWLADNNITVTDIKLTRWNGAAWEELETSWIKEDNTNTFYESIVPSFSHFAIVGAGWQVMSAVSEMEIQPLISPAISEPGIIEKTPGFEGITTIAAILIFGAWKRKWKRKSITPTA